MTKEEIKEWANELVKQGAPREEAWEIVNSALESQEGLKGCTCEDYPCCGH